MKTNIQVNPKYYRVTHPDGFVEIVRRDVYWDTGWKDPIQLKRIAEIEAIVADS